MSKKTQSPFVRWLFAQRGEDTPIGDLARDAYVDKSFPRGAWYLKDIKRHLKQAGACDGALKAASAAFQAFSAQEAASDSAEDLDDLAVDFDALLLEHRRACRRLARALYGPDREAEDYDLADLVDEVVRRLQLMGEKDHG